MSHKYKIKYQLNDGSYSQCMAASIDGRERRQFTQDEKFKLWMTLGISLNDEEGLSPIKKDIIEYFTTNVRNAFQPIQMNDIAKEELKELELVYKLENLHAYLNSARSVCNHDNYSCAFNQAAGIAQEIILWVKSYE